MVKAIVKKPKNLSVLKDCDKNKFHKILPLPPKYNFTIVKAV